MPGEIIKERMLRNLKLEADNHWGNDNPQETLEKMYLTDLKGSCMPDDYIGDDILKDLENKFYYFFGAIRDEIEPFIEIWVSPSYEDVTTTLMILDDKLLYKDHTKPWNFWFESEEALTDAMYLVYLKLLDKTEKQWECYTLVMGDIEAVAEHKGLDLEGIDIEDVIYSIRKAIPWALDNRDEIIQDAIMWGRKIADEKAEKES